MGCHSASSSPAGRYSATVWVSLSGVCQSMVMVVVGSCCQVSSMPSGSGTGSADSSSEEVVLAQAPVELNINVRSTKWIHIIRGLSKKALISDDLLFLDNQFKD